MKKIMAVTAAIVLAASLVAWAQQVLSRNAVGYQRVTLAKGSLSILRHDFEPLDTPLAISNVFAGLPLNSKVFLWRPDQSGYIIATRGLTGWGTDGSNILTRGRGFWVQIPVSAASNFYDVYLMGEVPDRFTAPTSVVAVAAGLTLAGYPYPVEIAWTNTTLAKMAPMGSKLFVWDGTNFIPYTRGLTGWGAATNLLVRPGMGFWLQWASATNWTEAKPYTWP